MPPEIAQWIVPLIVIFGTLSPAVIVGFMLYLHRVTRQDIRQMEERLGSRISTLESYNDELRGEDSKLRERMARLEGQFEQRSRFPRDPYSMMPAGDTPQAPDTGAEDVKISEANEGARQ